MFNIKRAGAAALATAALVGTSVVAASPASALTYKCKTSTKSIDDPSYSGPWADNWDITVKLCAARSGSTAYAYASVSWDGPVYGQADNTGIFNDAYFKLQIKKSVTGTDPVVKTTNFGGIEANLENSSANANYNGSYTTSTISYPVGGTRALADGELRLDWANDGKGYQTHGYSASPTV